MSRRSSFSPSLPLRLTAALLLYQSASSLSAQTPKPATDEPVQLDKFAVAAEKENNFSLPLDALSKDRRTTV